MQSRFYGKESRAVKMRRAFTLWRVMLLLLLLPGVLAGCGGGGGSSPSVNLGTNTASGGTAVGTQTCADCHGSILASNGFVSGQTVDNNGLADPGNTSSTFFESFAGASISGNWSVGVHGRNPGPQCETCHGNGSQHFGLGPIPNYAPGIATCETCHGTGKLVSVPDTDAFNLTAHFNGNGTPDAFFGLGGFGTSQASNNAPGQDGSLEVDASGAAVTKNQHIEECSACHSADQKGKHIALGDIFSPPQVVCASCHDPHRPSDGDGSRNVLSFFRSGGEVEHWQNLNFKPQRVNNNSLATGFGAKNLVNGTWIRPRQSYQFFAGGDPNNTFGGNPLTTVTGGYGAAMNELLNPNTAPVADWLRLSPERLCASCHTRGQQKYGNVATHQDDVYTQYRNSAHGFKFPTVGTPAGFSGAWWAASLLGGGPAATAGHVGASGYPYDMGGKALQNGYGRVLGGYEFDPLAPDNGANPPVPNLLVDGANGGAGGLRSGYVVAGGAAANSSNPIANAGPSLPFDGRPPKNYTNGNAPAGSENAYCYRCHQGISAIDYQRGTAWSTALGDAGDGESDAHILWGDSTATCISCHEPHKNGTLAGMSKNVRQPRNVSYNFEFTPGNLVGLTGFTANNYRGGVFRMMDLSDVPTDIGNNIVCLGCHQGADSGWSAWNQIRRYVRYGASGTTTPRVSLTATVTNGSNLVTAITTTTDATAVISTGMFVQGTGIPAGTTVTAVAANQITLSANATANASSVTFFPGQVLTANPQTSAAGEQFAENFFYNSGNTPIPDMWLGTNGGGQAQTLPYSPKDTHHFPGGALVYGRNGMEFAGNNYSDGIPEHRKTGCVGCHMNKVTGSEATSLGGHTWSMVDPLASVINAAGDYFDGGGNLLENTGACVKCHGATGVDGNPLAFHQIGVPQDWAGNGIVNDTVYNNLGVPKPITTTTPGSVYGTGVGGTGLMGRINEALWDQGIRWNPTRDFANYSVSGVNKFNGWTPNLQAASFNLSLANNAARLTNQSPVYAHDPFYSGQLLIDSIAHIPKFGQTTGAGWASADQAGTRPFIRPGLPTNSVGPTQHAGRNYRTLKY